ncbi:hypothetical protein ACFQ7A_28850 [Streptomyces sp. NPDC056528]|uniref:hypothetical protein n=1 Tax=Streptomyces sp. NPDC056528 TaxID=3345854 RepID=UPI0036B30663
MCQEEGTAGFLPSPSGGEPREAVDVPVTLAPTLTEALRVAQTKAFVILEGPCR